MFDLDMSPYAAFIWPAWGISVVVLGGVVIRAVAASRKWKAELKRLEADDATETRAQAAQSAVAQTNGTQAAPRAVAHPE